MMQSYALKTPPGLTIASLVASYASYATELSIRVRGPVVAPNPMGRSEQTATVQAAVNAVGLNLDVNICAVALWTRI